MKWNIFYLFFICFAVDISNQNQFILKFKLLDYNAEKLAKEVKKCNQFYFNDDCVLRFNVCLSSSIEKRCDIYQQETSNFRNTYQIADVCNIEIRLSNLPNNFLVNVTASIQKGSTKIWTKHFSTNMKDLMINIWKMGFLTTVKYIENLQLQYKLVFQCNKGYYGGKCEKVCDKTSLSLCLVTDCKNHCIHGKCKLNEKRDNALCICESGWYGVNCSTKIKICKLPICNSTNFICKDDICFCLNGNGLTRMFCFQDKIRDPSKQQNTDLIYILTIITVVIGILGLLGFVSITISRFCVERRKKKLNTVFYHNSYDDIFKVNTIDSDNKEME